MKIQVQELMNATCTSKDIGIGRNSHGLNHKGNRLITSRKAFLCPMRFPPLGFKVVKVDRIENLSLWRRYFNERELMKGQQHAPITPLKTERSWWYDQFHLDATVNEALLFHGTKASLVPLITLGGFEDRIAELGGYFGALLMPTLFDMFVRTLLICIRYDLVQFVE